MAQVERRVELRDHRVPGALAAYGGVGDVAQRALSGAEQMPDDVAQLACEATVGVVDAEEAHDARPTVAAQNASVPRYAGGSMPARTRDGGPGAEALRCSGAQALASASVISVAVVRSMPR